MDIRKSFFATVHGKNHHWWSLIVTSLGTFMTTYDMGAVTISLPQIMTEFRASLTLTSWVLLAQLLTATALLLPAGRLGDIVGRKKIYNLGFVVFIIGSLLSSLSQNLPQLILCRILQAGGASMIQTSNFAMVTAVFPDRERGKGLGINSGVAAFGATAGPAIGGLILSTLGWRAIFFVNVPVGIAGGLLAYLILQEKRVSAPPERVVRSFDVIGACLSTVAIGSLVAGLSFGQERGWSSIETRLFLVASAAAIVIFPWFESRQKPPLVATSLLTNRPFALNNMARCTLFMAMQANILLMPFYLQIVLGYSPLETGMLIAPTSLVIAASTPMAGWAVTWVNSRYLSALGMAVMGVGLFLVTQLGVSSNYHEVLWRLIVMGLGYGMFQAPNNTSVMDSVTRDKFGIASGIMSLGREVGRSTGTALASAIVVTSMFSTVGAVSLYSIRAQGAAAVQGPALLAFSDGIARAYLVAALICIPGVIFCLARGKTARDEGKLNG